MPTNADVVAFGVMLSGMAMAVFMVVFLVLCLQCGGPIMATWTVTRWFWRIGRKDPFPAITGMYWASTTSPFPGWPVVKSLIATLWLVAVGCGVIAVCIDAVQGPKERRFFTDPATGQPQMVVSRMREKRWRPQKMEKALKQMTPARNRFAYELGARRYAKNQSRAAVGLPPMKDSWARRKLMATLPTAKPKRPRSTRDGRRRARVDLVALPPPPGLPPPPKVSLVKRPKAGVDPAARPAAPGRPSRAGFGGYASDAELVEAGELSTGEAIALAVRDAAAVDPYSSASEREGALS